MVRIEPITTEAGIESLVPEWRALWRRVPAASPFQSPEWLLPWWRCFGTGAPLVVTARAGCELIAMLPLYLRQEPGCRKLLPFGISLSDYLDALVDPEYPEVVDALLAALADIPGWDECHLPDLVPTAALLAAKGPTGLVDERSNGEACPVLPLPSAVERLREVVPRKTLRDLRQARRRAAEAGSVTVARAEPATLAASMGELFRLHEERWRGRTGQGVCADPVVRNFHLAAAGRSLDADMLRLYLLRIDELPAAVYYGFAAKGAAYAYLGGFDPDCAELSVGTQILAHAIEAAIGEGAREFHFLRGGESYKYAWGAVARPSTARTFRRLC